MRKTIKTSQIKSSLNSAINQLPKLSFEELANIPVNKLAEHDCITKQNLQNPNEKKVFSFKTQWIAIAACCVMLCFIGGYSWFSSNVAIASVITMYINPSFEISLNKQEIVLSVEPLNDDAKTVLNNKDFSGEKLDNMTEELFSLIASNNFISNDKNNVTISVQNSNKSQVENVEKELREHIEKALSVQNIKPNIVIKENMKENTKENIRENIKEVNTGNQVDELPQKSSALENKPVSEQVGKPVSEPVSEIETKPLESLKPLESITPIKPNKPPASTKPTVSIKPIESMKPIKLDMDDHDSDKPDSDKPDSDKPDSDKPDSDKPDSDKPDSDKPDSDKPDSDKPDSDKPDSDKPDSDKPDSDKPDSDKPDSDKPDSDEPDSDDHDSDDD